MERLNNIRLIGLDLDGTLLNENKRLCDGAEETLKKARAQSIYLVPVTGRPYKGVPDFIKGSPLFDYLVTSNGAQIIDNKTGRALFSFTIDNKKSLEIIEVLRNADCMFEPFADGVGYAQQYIYDRYLKDFKGTALEDYFFSSRVIEDDIEGLFRGTGRRADEFFVNCTDKGVRDGITKRLDLLGGLQYWLLADRFLEITAEGCDKGAALETLCRHLNIGIENTAAFGDGENDLSFLEKAGVSVVMGNAFPSVKEKADIIADTNDNNGVCKFIEDFILRGASCDR